MGQREKKIESEREREIETERERAKKKVMELETNKKPYLVS